MIGVKKYRKMPVTIEAVRITPGRAGVCAAWVRESGGAATAVRSRNGEWTVGVLTLNGWVVAELGEYIVRGVNGEFYPCKPDIFEKTYEPAEAPRAGTPTSVEEEIELDDIIAENEGGDRED